MKPRRACGFFDPARSAGQHRRVPAELGSAPTVTRRPTSKQSDGRGFAATVACADSGASGRGRQARPARGRQARPARGRQAHRGQGASRRVHRGQGASRQVRRGRPSNHGRGRVHRCRGGDRRGSSPSPSSSPNRGPRGHPGTSDNPGRTRVVGPQRRLRHPNQPVPIRRSPWLSLRQAERTFSRGRSYQTVL